MQKVSKNFHQKKILAVAVLFFVIFFFESEKQCLFWINSYLFTFFSDWYYGKVRACGTLISPFNSFKLRRKKSGNTEVFYHALATYDISLRCSVLWNPKKYDLQMKSRKPIYNKNQRFLEFFSNGIAISKDLLESNFRNIRRFCHILGIWKLQLMKLNILLLHYFYILTPLCTMLRLVPKHI